MGHVGYCSVSRIQKHVLSVDFEAICEIQHGNSSLGELPDVSVGARQSGGLGGYNVY